MIHPFFLVFYIVVGGELKHGAYIEQGHIYGFPDLVSCQRAERRELRIAIREGLHPGENFATLCMQDEAEMYSGGGEYEETWDKHRYDYSA